MVGSRVVVERPIHAELVERLAQAFSQVSIGRWDEQVQMGPLVSARQRERVLGYVEAGKAEGARLVTGGGIPAGETYDDGYFVEPTLFDDVDPQSRIAQEEIFGPVLSVIPVDDEESAIEVANGTAVRPGRLRVDADVGRAVRVAKAIEAGQVLGRTPVEPATPSAHPSGATRAAASAAPWAPTQCSTTPRSRPSPSTQRPDGPNSP